MYNEEVLKKLIIDYGEVQTMLYCRMQAARYTYLYEAYCKEGGPNCNEYDYERDWWLEAYNKLNNNKNS